MHVSTLSFLVVEDDEFQRAMVVMLLKRLGARVVLEAQDGHDALERLREANPPVDIIISDLDMPTMDGLSFVREQMARRPVPIIVISIASGMTHAATIAARRLPRIRKSTTTTRIAPSMRFFSTVATVASTSLDRS